ncbi:hypothetical protein NDU88_004680 [Pleurodeles waltl]|uniref:Secreted protein n=1 Tax=Pleurodeles waltl TaxID=8319 RepID=A0AAV7W5X9_PLEWA|nr:hypothetical protein NDU88_004680 [Pleurodeles waltl]
MTQSQPGPAPREARSLPRGGRRVLLQTRFCLLCCVLIHPCVLHSLIRPVLSPGAHQRGLPLQAVTHNVMPHTTRRSAVVESRVLATHHRLVPNRHTRTSSPRVTTDTGRSSTGVVFHSTGLSHHQPVPQSRSQPI